jgi:hypothetical protein
MPTIEKEIQTGESVQVGEYLITPQTRVWRIRLPGRRAGLIWNRPAAVRVRMPDGQETTLPIRDITRVMIWSMLAGGLLGAVIVGLTRRKGF